MTVKIDDDYTIKQNIHPKFITVDEPIINFGLRSVPFNSYVPNRIFHNASLSYTCTFVFCILLYSFNYLSEDMTLIILYLLLIFDMYLIVLSDTIV